MAKVEIELEPFRVPNFVIVKLAPRPRQEGCIEAPKYALSDLDESVLSELCKEFRRGVFERAGKEDPAA